jgi:hypothetical protein
VQISQGHNLGLGMMAQADQMKIANDNAGAEHAEAKFVHDLPR